MKTRPIGIHTLVQEAIRRARNSILAGPCFFSEKTIRIKAGLSVHELFLTLEQRGKVSSAAYRAHYHPVRRAVLQALCYDRRGVV